MRFGSPLVVQTLPVLPFNTFMVFSSLVQVRLSEVLSRRISQNPSEAAAASSAEEVLRQTQLINPEEGLALAPSGWHPVRASFEVDKVN